MFPFPYRYILYFYRGWHVRTLQKLQGSVLVGGGMIAARPLCVRLAERAELLTGASSGSLSGDAQEPAEEPAHAKHQYHSNGVMIDPSKDKFAYFKDNIQTAEDKVRTAALVSAFSGCFRCVF